MLRGVRALGRRAEVRRLDLAQLPGAADVVDELAGSMGGVDVLVNDAGTGHRTPLLDLDLDTWREVLATDLDGAFLCLQRAARRMVAAGRGGRIITITITITSVHEHAPRVGTAAYCAAKGGLGLLTKVAALELAEHGITVNAVAPGEIATGMTGQEDQDPTAPGHERQGVPLRRSGDAREVAAVVAFLASPAAGYATTPLARQAPGPPRHRCGVPARAGAVGTTYPQCSARATTPSSTWIGPPPCGRSTWSGPASTSRRRRRRSEAVRAGRGAGQMERVSPLRSL